MARFASFRKIITLAGPLILSQMGVMLMQIVDGIFLAHYSESAIAAIGPAAMSFWLICGFFMGVVGYSNTFVAQYVGADRPDRVGAVVWQGLYLAVAAGLVLAAASMGATSFFQFVGHAPQIIADEVSYFRILAWGGSVLLFSGALSGFYAGRHDNSTLMLAHLAGGLVNAVFDALLIFGWLGFPRMGIAGAAWATVIGHGVQVAWLGTRFFAPRFRAEFATWRARAIDLRLLLRLVRFGSPNGLRYVLEIGSWTVFLLIIGRIDAVGLAASNIAWRINGMAFFPVIGLSIAVSMLVGQAQGAGRPDLSRKATQRGLVLGQIWMMGAALLMVLMPDMLLRLFLGAAGSDGSAVYALSVRLLRYVAVYCLADNFNIMFMAMLSGAGDTRWMLITSGVMHLLFIVSLLALAFAGVGTLGLWFAATVFICVLACLWVFRFLSVKWEDKRVIEYAPPDIVNPAFPELAPGVGSPGL